MSIMGLSLPLLEAVDRALEGFNSASETMPVWHYRTSYLQDGTQLQLLGSSHRA